MNKYRVFNLKERKQLYPLDKILLFNSGRILVEENEKWIEKSFINSNYVYLRNSFKTDSNNIDIYEYDLIRVSNEINNKKIIQTGIVIFRAGMFYLSDIHIEGCRVNKQLSFLELFQEKNNVFQIEILGSILELKEGVDYIRDRFTFTINTKNKDALAIDSKGDIYIKTENNFEPYKPLNMKLDYSLSTGVFNVNNDLIYEEEVVTVKCENHKFKAKITLRDGVYYLINTTNKFEPKELILNNFFNERKYKFIY